MPGRYINTDRFGNQYTVVGFKANKNGYPVAYWENGAKLYKLELTPANKDGVMNWLRITQLKRRGGSGSMSTF